MEKAIAIMCVIIAFFIGFALGNRDTIDREDHVRICSAYDKEISDYRDYIEGLDKVVNLSEVNKGALEVLYDKINNERNN